MNATKYSCVVSFLYKSKGLYTHYTSFGEFGVFALFLRRAAGVYKCLWFITITTIQYIKLWYALAKGRYNILKTKIVFISIFRMFVSAFLIYGEEESWNYMAVFGS